MNNAFVLLLSCVCCEVESSLVIITDAYRWISMIVPIELNWSLLKIHRNAVYVLFTNCRGKVSGNLLELCRQNNDRTFYQFGIIYISFELQKIDSVSIYNTLLHSTIFYHIYSLFVWKMAALSCLYIFDAQNSCFVEIYRSKS